MQTSKTADAGWVYAVLLTLILSPVLLIRCNSSAGNETGWSQPPQSLPVFVSGKVPASTYQEYTAALEGSKDVEIRPQVDGYLDRIYIDEGAYVKKGQALFHINDRPFREQVNNAKAALASAKANLAHAEINVARLAPLVDNKVISDVQLRTAQAARDAAAAGVEQARAMVQSAEINLGFTTVRSPVDGYAGRIPHKTGSLVGLATAEPLTIVSEIREVHAYFSMTEPEFLSFENRFPGKTVAEKIKSIPPVELVLADNSVYPEKGRVETVSGQFSHSMGAISFRASFKNINGLLRSGNTGRIRIPQKLSEAFVIPQESTFELQDKVFVFMVGDSNKVNSAPLAVSGRTGNYYLVEKGLSPGTRIVYTGLDRLQEGAVIIPETISLDSMLKQRPM